MSRDDDASRRHVRFRDGAELLSPRAVEPQVAELVVEEKDGAIELPVDPAEIAKRTVSLQPLLDAYPALRSLRVEANVFSARVAHATLERVSLAGAVALTPLAMPKLTDLTLEARGDDGGAALPFEPFAWLLEAAELPDLRSLDLRFVSIELTKRKPSFVARWASAPVVGRLHFLGLPGDEIKVSELKKALGAFAGLQALVVHDLASADGEPISATDKNPIGGNVLVETELGNTPLDRVAAEIGLLPRLEHLKPTMDDAAFDEVSRQLLASRVRYSASALVKSLKPFCKRRQWKRVEALILFAEKRCPSGARSWTFARRWNQSSQRPLRRTPMRSRSVFTISYTSRTSSEVSPWRRGERRS